MGQLSGKITREARVRSYESYTMPKTRIFGLHFRRRQYVCLIQFVPKATALGEMTQNNGHYAAESHSRSPLSVPSDFLILTYVQDIREYSRVFTVDRGSGEPFRRNSRV